MVIDLPRNEVANDEVVPFEDLMAWRRLMDPAGFVVRHIEDIRIEVAVPADHVVWMTLMSDYCACHAG